MKNIYQLLLLIPIILGLSACGGTDSDDTDSNQSKSTSSAAQSDSARFTKEIGKGCDVLTAELVGSTFSVPADNLEQASILGCIYTWKSEAEELTAHITQIRIHQSDAVATAWFSKITKNRTVEEVRAEFDMVAAQLDKRKELDTDAKKSVAKVFLDAAVAEAVNFKDVANLGDEARSGADGNISVRVDNLTFIVTAYKGPKQPKPDFSGMDTKQMIAAAKTDAQDWATKTAAQRVKDGTQLASAVVESL